MTVTGMVMNPMVRRWHQGEANTEEVARPACLRESWRAGGFGNLGL